MVVKETQCPKVFPTNLSTHPPTVPKCPSHDVTQHSTQVPKCLTGLHDAGHSHSCGIATPVPKIEEPF